MSGSETEFLKGQFLMAMPGLPDPNFSMTVTCICEHTPLGAMGLVVNRPHPTLTLEKIFEELKMAFAPQAGATPVYVGGPVHIQEVFILHGPPFDWAGTMTVTPFTSLSNTKDILSAIALGKGPENFIVTLGCAGWGPGQLDDEIKENAWLTLPVSEDILFETPPANRWEEAVGRLGIDPGLLSDSAGHA